AIAGQLLVPQLGNAQHRLSSVLTNLLVGKYYWSVQTVDTSFTGSPFAEESSFVVGTAILHDASLGITNGHFGFNLIWEPGKVAVVQTSSNLINWEPIWTN